MSQNSVSPPTGGTSTAWRTAPIEGMLAPGDVVVPEVLVAADVGRLLEPHQLGGAGVGRDERVDLEFPEPTGEGHVALGGERLVAEEQDLVGEQGLAQLVDDGVVEIGGEVEAVHLGAEGGADLLDLEGVPGQPGQPGRAPRRGG